MKQLKPTFFRNSSLLLAMSIGLQQSHFALASESPTHVNSVVFQDQSSPSLDPLSSSDAELEKSWADMITVSVSSSPTIDTNGETDVNNSNLTVKSENENFRELLNDIGVESYKGISHVLSFTVRVSGIPTFLKDSVQKKLDKRVDEKVAVAKEDIASKVNLAYDQVHSFQSQKMSELDLGLQAQRPIAMNAAKAKIDAILASNPGILSFPQEQQDALRDRMYADAGRAVDQQLDQFKQQKLKELSAGINAKKTEIAAKGAAGNAQADATGKKKKDEIADRLDEIQLETTFQEIAFVVATPIAGGRALIFAKVGKFHPETAGKVNDNMQTALEETRPVNSPVQRGVGIAPTGAVDIGTNIILKPGAQLQLDVIVAHDRAPWISGQQYTGVVVSMLESDYAEHKQFHKIDSVTFRALYKTRDGEAYGSVGNFNGKLQGQVGVRIVISDKLSLHIDGTKGERQYLKEGASGFLVYQLFPRIALFGGIEYVDGFMNPGISSRANGTVDYVTANAGLSVNVINTKIKMCKVKVDVKTEGVYYIDQSGFAEALKTDLDLVSGAQLNASCGSYNGK